MSYMSDCNMFLYNEYENVFGLGISPRILERTRIGGDGKSKVNMGDS